MINARNLDLWNYRTRRRPVAGWRAWLNSALRCRPELVVKTLRLALWTRPGARTRLAGAVRAMLPPARRLGDDHSGNHGRTTARLVLPPALMGVLVFAQACLGDKPTDLHDPRDETVQDAESALREDLGEDPYLMGLAREIPGFAGIHYDSPGSDRLVISVTEANTSDFAVAEQAVRRSLMETASPSPTARPRRVEFQKQVVEYSFIDLARHRARLRPHVFSVPGVVGLAVDERENRIAVGVSDESAIATVRDLATGMAIPLEMLSFHEASSAEPLHMRPEALPPLPDDDDCPEHRPGCRLTGPVPDGMLQGGYEIGTERGGDKIGTDQKACTLGFSGFQDSSLDSWYFVTNSHCSDSTFYLDGGSFYQPREGIEVGREIRDPELDSATECGTDYPCRKSDAALVMSSLHAPIAPGRIGRTKTRHVEAGDNGDLEVNLENPFIPITAVGTVVNGETIDKVGRSTGWTAGDVSDTCYDVVYAPQDGAPPSSGRVLLCSIKATMEVWGGDSGSPVFRYVGDDDADHDSYAELLGLLFVGSPRSRIGYASRIDNIARELELGESGELDVKYRDWPIVEIVGPRFVIPPAECEWTVDLTGYVSSRENEYAWTGVLTGDTKVITSKELEASGWLKAKVKDSFGMSATDSMFVEYLPPPDTSIHFPPGCLSHPPY